MITTTGYIPGYKIVKTLGLVVAVQEFNMIRPRKAVFNAIGELIAQTKERGGNAIIGLKITTSPGQSAMAVIVYGTAVKVVKENNAKEK